MEEVGSYSPLSGCLHNDVICILIAILMWFELSALKTTF